MKKEEIISLLNENQFKKTPVTATEQFGVIFFLSVTYPDVHYHCVEETYQVSESLSVPAKSMGDAIFLAEIIYEQFWHDKAFFNAIEKFSAALFFNVRKVRVFGQKQDTLINGEPGNQSLFWVKPIKDKTQRINIKKQQEALYKKAAIEARWDNFETAKQLREKAVRLDSYLVDQGKTSSAGSLSAY